MVRSYFLTNRQSYEQAAGLAAESPHLKERSDAQMRAGRRVGVRQFVGRFCLLVSRLRIDSCQRKA